MHTRLFNRTGVHYEVAIDILGAIIAHYSEAIGIERSKEAPDEFVIEQAQQAKADLHDVRDNLDPNSEDDIQQVIRQYSPQARQLYEL